MPERSTTAFTPRRVLLLIAALILVALLFAPSGTSVNASRETTSYSTDAFGSRGIYEVLGKLGFSVQRWLRPMRQTLPTDVVYVVASPTVELTGNEVHSLLNAVRSGAGLFVRTSVGETLADSLRMGSRMVLPRRDTARVTVLDTLNPFSTRLKYVLRRLDAKADSAKPIVLPAGTHVFQSIMIDGENEPVTIGYPLGRGRVIAFADPTFLRNSTVRQGAAAVEIVRQLEWLSAGKSRPIWFDEYHHGYGAHASVLRLTARGLSNNAAGRVLLQLALAGIVLIFALGIRPIAPKPVARIERRSPLEHVDALARAYSTVRAQPLATRLLVRGLRRRHQAVRSRADEGAYLSALREHKPELTKDIEQVSRSLSGDGNPDTLSELSGAISRIEKGLRT